MEVHEGQGRELLTPEDIGAVNPSFLTLGSRPVASFSELILSPLLPLA